MWAGRGGDCDLLSTEGAGGGPLPGGLEGTEAPELSGTELGSLGAAGGERSGRADSLFLEGLFWAEWRRCLNWPGGTASRERTGQVWEEGGSPETRRGAGWERGPEHGGWARGKGHSCGQYLARGVCYSPDAGVAWWTRSSRAGQGSRAQQMTSWFRGRVNSLPGQPGDERGGVTGRRVAEWWSGYCICELECCLQTHMCLGLWISDPRPLRTVKSGAWTSLWWAGKSVLVRSWVCNGVSIQGTGSQVGHSGGKAGWEPPLIQATRALQEALWPSAHCPLGSRNFDDRDVSKEGMRVSAGPSCHPPSSLGALAIPCQHQWPLWPSSPLSSSGAPLAQCPKAMGLGRSSAWLEWGNYKWPFHFSFL